MEVGKRYTKPQYHTFDGRPLQSGLKKITFSELLLLQGLTALSNQNSMTLSFQGQFFIFQGLTITEVQGSAIFS